MEESEVARQLGSLDSRMTGVEKDVTEIKTDVKTLLVGFAESRGGKNAITGSLPFLALGVSVLALILSGSGV